MEKLDPWASLDESIDEHYFSDIILNWFILIYSILYILNLVTHIKTCINL